MARKKTYEEKIAEHIAAVVAERHIEEVLHFTKLENLPGILEHGLGSRTDLINAGLGYSPSDGDRLDGKDDAISVSVSCYSPRMFEAKRKRGGNTPWTILVLDPSVLCDHPCRFFRQGAPTSATKYKHGKRNGGYALEKLFEEASFSADPNEMGLRAKHDLPQSWPTFSDAEVQVMNPIDPGYICGVLVETSEHEDCVKEVFKSAGRDDCEVKVHPFEPRITSTPYRWG